MTRGQRWKLSSNVRERGRAGGLWSRRWCGKGTRTTLVPCREYFHSCYSIPITGSWNTHHHGAMRTLIRCLFPCSIYWIVWNLRGSVWRSMKNCIYLDRVFFVFIFARNTTIGGCLIYSEARDATISQHLSASISKSVTMRKTWAIMVWGRRVIQILFVSICFWLIVRVYL